MIATVMESVIESCTMEQPLQISVFQSCVIKLPLPISVFESIFVRVFMEQGLAISAFDHR